MLSFLSRARWFAGFPTRFERPRLSRTFGLTVSSLEPRETPAYLGGVNVAVGDVNGDRYPDLVLSHASEGTPLVRVVDGATGTIILDFMAYEESFTGGVYVACGDVDGDGQAEIITGTGNTGGPNVSVFNGKTGSKLFSFFPYEDSFRGGVIVAAADTNGDGIAEIITGTGVGGGPRVQVIDARTKETKANFFAYESSFRGGVLVGAGDLDGDNRDEIITGTGVGGGPRVQAFNASTLEPTLNFFAYENSFRGGVLVGAGDLDGDGKDEVITGTGVGGGPVVTAFQASTAKEQARFLAFDESIRGGVSVTGFDLTGDGKTEMITASGPGSNATVSIFSPDGATQNLTFSPFDPEEFPNKAISVQMFVGEDPTDLPPVGLTVSASTVLAGSIEQLVFTARSSASGVPSKVQLFASNSSGVQGDYLYDLFDDGDFTHRDPYSKDLIYHNTGSVNYAAPGSNFYLLKMTVGTQTETYTAKVDAVRGATTAQSQAANSLITATQTRLNSLLQSGSSVDTALQTVATELTANALVKSGSVAVDSPGVGWVTTTGIPSGVSANLAPGANELDGSGSSSSMVEIPQSSDLTISADLAGPDCKGKVLLLAPYSSQVGMAGMDTASKAFQDKGWDVTFQSDAAVTVADFANLQQYDAVVITTHGLNDPTTGNTTLLFTSEAVSDARDKTYASDLAANRLVKNSGFYCVTPSYITYHSGKMNGTVVYVAACRGAKGTDMANAFLNLGAASYSGYTDNVKASFAGSRTISTVNHLLNGGTVGTIPGVGDVEPPPDSKPARYRLFRKTANINSKMQGQCDLLKDYDLRVTYTWASSQKDLDTGTTFVNQTVGYAYPSSTYMSFSGDDTTTGGRETVTVKLYEAYQAGLWRNTTPVSLKAGWFSPSKGSGPAVMTVSLVHKVTGVTKDALQRTISPGSQSGGASTVVGTATISVTGAAGQEIVTYTLSP